MTAAVQYSSSRGGVQESQEHCFLQTICVGCIATAGTSFLLSIKDGIAIMHPNKDAV